MKVTLTSFYYHTLHIDIFLKHFYQKQQTVEQSLWGKRNLVPRTCAVIVATLARQLQTGTSYAP